MRYRWLLKPRRSLHTEFPWSFHISQIGSWLLQAVDVLLLWGIIQIPKKAAVKPFCVGREIQRTHDSCVPLQILLYPERIFPGTSAVNGELLKAMLCCSGNWWRPGAALVFVFCYFKKCLFQRAWALIVWLVMELSLSSPALWFFFPSKNLCSTSVTGACTLRSALS